MSQIAHSPHSPGGIPEPRRVNARIVFRGINAVTVVEMHAVSRRTIMLVLSRHENEAIVIDGHIKITVVEIRGNKIRLGIEAPKDVAVWREELVVCSPNELEVAVA